MSYVYLIGNKNVGLYKIGATKSPAKRLKSNQTSCPYLLEVIYIFESNFAYKLEKVLHNDYLFSKKDENENEIKGEWFSLNELQVEQFMSKCSLYERSFKVLKENNNHFFK